MSKKALVTGGTGFLGHHLVRRLSEMGVETTVLVRKSSDLSSLKPYSPKIVHGDVLNRQSLLVATENKDMVFHLAGLIAYKKKDHKMMEQVNVAGTQNLLDACVTQSTPKVLHLSSVAAIGFNQKRQKISEDFKFDFEQWDLGYFKTKHKAERLCFQYFQDNNLPVYLINPSTIYGYGDGKKGSRKTQVKVAQGRFPLYPPGGVNVVHVSDVIDLIFLILDRGQPARRYIAAGDNMTIKELFKSIATLAGAKPPYLPIPRSLIKSLGFIGDLRTRYLNSDTSLSSETAITSTGFHWFSNQRIRKELGFSPRPSVEALQDSVQWMKDQGLL